jgi:hypothetical protein
MSQIPPINHPVWEKLAAGKVKHKFKLFAANMAVDRAMREFSQGGTDKTKICGELHSFFAKYSNHVASELASVA